MTATAQTDPAHPADAAADVPWWLGFVQGVALLILGVLCLAAPGATLSVVVQLAGIYWLVAGILGLVSLAVDRSRWLWKLVAGVVGILAGIAVIQHPLWATILVPSTLILVIGIFGIVSGILGMIHAFGDRSFMGVLLGAFGAILGLVLVANPVIGAATLPFVVGIFAAIGGIMALVAAFAERGARRRRAAAGAADPATPTPVSTVEATPAAED